MGHLIVIDTLFEEEESSLFSYVVPVTEGGQVLAGFKVGKGHTSIETLCTMIKVRIFVNYKLYYYYIICDIILFCTLYQKKLI